MPWAWERGIEPVAMPGAMPGVTSGATPGTQTGTTPGAAAIELGAQGDQASQGTGTPNDGALSVSEAVLLAKEQIAQLPNLVVTGEVTGFRGPNARSGHCYFQLKDENAAMDVTMWRWAHQKLGFELKDGLKVQLTGGFQVYDKRGSLSFNATSATVAGEGLLRQQVAELARKLEREGLMDASRKRKIPRFCERVCVVTSLSGAVIDDVKRTLARRNPLVEIWAVGCMVQGAGAAPTIIRALNVAASARPDAILLVRGGGSFEDLMTFNDEALARAVAACPVPVICGIGHEPDTSICDMVADRRCSTPTAAAESVAPAIDELASVMEERRGRMVRALSSLVAAQSQQLEAQGAAATRALTVSLGRRREYLDALAARRCLQDPLAPLVDRRASLELSSERLHDAMPRILERRDGDVLAAGRRLAEVGTRLLRPYEQRLSRSAATLDALSPLRVLARGYAIAKDEQGHVVSRAEQLQVGDVVDLRFGAGGAQARVESLIPGAAGGADAPGNRDAAEETLPAAKR